MTNVVLTNAELTNAVMTDETWTNHVRRTLQSYDEPLLRQVTGKLCKPRNHWPAEELLDRSLATLANAAVLDRRLKDQSPAARMLLALIGQSRQPRWHVGNLVEILAVLGQDDPLGVVTSLLQAGLLYPELFPRSLAEEPSLSSRSRLKDIASWVTQAHPPIVFAHPAVTARAITEDFTWPEGPAPTTLSKTPALQEADGLEWLLRLAVMWQLAAVTPFRRTQQGDLFKRDLDRLQADPLLSQAPADSLAPLPDPSQFTMLLGSAIGVLGDSNGDLKAGEFPGSWREGLPKAVASIWSVLPVLENWNAVYALDAQHSPGNPYPSAHLLALLLLGRLPDGAFASPQAIERWIVERHPYWSAPTLDANGQPIAPARRSGKNAPTSQERGIARFILGIAHPLRLVQATRDPNGDWLVRLSPLGRWVLGLCDAPPMAAAFPQTVLVQPNLEILAYRQGLTPELIVQLSKFATWKGLGAACTMQLESHGVYRALELGETFDSIVQTLERHGMKSLPAAVLDSLRTWSNKRDRLSVYTAAALFEFASPAELNEALARGLPAVRLTDRLAVVSNEEAIDYRNFRLTATRDYCLPPEKCVDVEADGVTLSIDLARSDLLLESEVKAFAELAPLAPAPGRRLYLLTSASLQSARANGFSLANLESWFNQRTGLPVSPAAQLLFTAPDHPPAELRRQIVLHVMDAELADGLQQWPATRDLIQSRLGPTALVVAEKDVETLSLRCRELGLKLFHSEG